TVTLTMNGGAVLDGQVLPVLANQMISFSAAVTAPGLAIQLGTVAFNDGSAPPLAVAIGVPFTKSFTPGSHSITVRYTPANNYPLLIPSSVKVNLNVVDPGPWKPLPKSVFVTAADAGGGPDVKVFGASLTGVDKDQPLDEFFAFDMRFTGGVRVAVGD